MKKIRFIVVLMVGILLITGCQQKNKKAVSSQEYLSICKEKKVEMYNAISMFGFAEEAYITNNENYEILYVIGKKQSDISGMYVDEIQSLYNSLGAENDNDVKTNILNGKNWQSIELQYENRYAYMAIVDDTLLEIRSDLMNKELVTSIKDAMKY